MEGFLCAKLKGRIQLHAAVYRHSHNQQTRTWVTLDGKEIFSAADLSYYLEHEIRYQKLRKDQQLTPLIPSLNWKELWQSPERLAIHDSSEQVSQQLLLEGILDSYIVQQAWLAYPQLSIEDARISENPFIRALTYFDRRTGRRTLQKMQMPIHPVEKRFYKIRLQAEK